MSQENVEIVRRAYEVNNSLGRTGAEFVDPEEIAPDFWARLAPDVELLERLELPDAKTYRGRDEVKAFWRKTQEIFAELRWEPQSSSTSGTPWSWSRTSRRLGAAVT
jgi:hypothetical protein